MITEPETYQVSTPDSVGGELPLGILAQMGWLISL
jgi:hypothetical protein